jgi:hypothetical protein
VKFSEIACPTLIEAAAGKNVHLVHLEDLVFDQGYAGAEQAIQYLEGVRDMLAAGGSATRVTVKWDGAPAIVAGIDPIDRKFFVGTKSVFAKSPKLVKDKKSLDEYYGGSPLYDILKHAFTYLKKLGISGVLQGDLLFSPERPIESSKIDGEQYLTFRPNTITYAVKEGTTLADRVKRAKLGIVFHTTYTGDSIETMTANFGANISGLTQTPDVWVEDAYYKDYTGTVTLTDSENASVMKDISTIRNQLQKLTPAKFNQFLQEPDLSAFLNQYVNALTRAGQTVADPKGFISGFTNFYKQKIQAEIGQLKGGPSSPAVTRRIEKIDATTKFIRDNFDTLVGMLEIYRQIIRVKLVLIKKLNQAESIGTFLKTDAGYKVTSPEGFVAIGHAGGAVKLNDRLEFNRANFILAKEW